MNFNEENYSNESLSNTYFEYTTKISGNSSCRYKINFFSDFSGLKFEGEGRYKSSVACSKNKYIKFDTNDAIALKNMVDETIDQQIETHTALLEEAKLNVSFNRVLSAYQQFTQIRVNYRSRQDGRSSCIDDERKILNTLISMDKSSFSVVKNPTRYNESNGFSYYQANTKTDYEIDFCYESQELTLKKNFIDFDDKKSYVTLTYEIDNENANLLMNIAKEVASN